MPSPATAFGSELALRGAVIVVDPINEWERLLASIRSRSLAAVCLITNELTDSVLQRQSPLKYERDENLFPGPLFNFMVKPDSAQDARDVYGHYEKLLLLAERERLTYVACFGASDHGCEFADTLAGLLGLPHNSLATVHARRNKAMMRKVLQENRVKSPDWALCTSPEEALKFARRNGYPVVLKAAASYSTAERPQARMCSNGAEVQTTADMLLSSPDGYGRRLGYFLVEEVHLGDPYVVTIMGGGVQGVRVTSIWRYSRQRTAQPWPQDEGLVSDSDDEEVFSCVRPKIDMDIDVEQPPAATTAPRPALERGPDAGVEAVGSVYSVAGPAACPGSSRPESRTGASEGAPLPARERPPGAPPAPPSPSAGLRSLARPATPPASRLDSTLSQRCLPRARGDEQFVRNVPKYERADLEDCTAAPHAPLCAFARRIAAALHLSLGPASIKVKQESDGNLILVGFSPTLANEKKAALPMLAVPAWDPFDATLAAFLGEEVPFPASFKPQTAVVQCLVPVPSCGTIIQITGEEAVTQLKTYHSHALLVGRSDEVPLLCPPLTYTAAHVWLVAPGDAREQIESDAAEVLTKLRVVMDPGFAGISQPNVCTTQ